MPLKNLRQNPIDSSTSPVAIANESHTVAEFDELPGVYGFILEERPVAGSVTITSDDTAADVFSIVTTDPLAGQAFVDFNTNRGYVIFNPSENGRAMLVDYNGLGANMTVESVGQLAAVGFAASIHAATGKTTPVDADEFGLADSAASWGLKKVTLADLARVIFPTGSYLEFAGTSAPTGFLACNGAAVSRTTYAALFAVVGTTYGAGNGSTTFNLPDRRGISAVGAGTHGTMTRADSSAFDGGSVGATRNDQMQGHHHSNSSYGTDNASDFLQCTNNGANNNGPLVTGNGGSIGTNQTQITYPFTDGTNGTPRTGNETRPAQMAVLVCIKT